MSTTMHAPPHPGRLVAAEIEALGLSVAEVAKRLGVTRQQLYKIVNGLSSISPEMAYRLEVAIGSTAESWLRVQAAHDLWKVRERAASISVRPKDEPRLVPVARIEDLRGVAKGANTADDRDRTDRY